MDEMNGSDEVDKKAIKSQMEALLQEYASLHIDGEIDVGEFSEILKKRQKIIDQIAHIDENLTDLRKIIASSKELSDILAAINKKDRELLERAKTHRENLHAALRKAGQGRTATRGYRVNIPRSPAMIDHRA